MRYELYRLVYNLLRSLETIMTATMIIALLLMPQARGTLTKTSWFGPVTATLDIKTAGNPFDPSQNDIQVIFVSPSGKTTTRIAFYSHGKWHVTLAATEKGTYQGTVIQNGSPTEAKTTLTLSRNLPTGFVRTTPDHRFAFDNGQSYWPLGFNFAWRSDNVPDLPAALPELKRYGVNWTRIWADHWDGKNPFWVKGNPLQFDEAPLDRWQAVTEAAEKGDVKYQFVLFHHGPWSSRVNSNWGENPWNKANGGFLDTPTEFFSSPQAKKIAKAWLRYAVARYGHSPSVMAWELFNEVEWVDPNYDQKEQLVGDWHQEMAAYLRSIDPYRHLVTTSSRMSLPIYADMDYYQPHGYPNRVQNLLLASPPKADKPYFFGEVGPAAAQAGPAIQRTAIRDSIFTALVMGHSGSAQYWYWDNVYPQNLLDEYAFASKILKASGVLTQQIAKFTPKLIAPAADLVVSPGGDWEPVHKFSYSLPEEANELGGMSSFFQGSGHAEMRPQPIKLTFTSPKAGVVTIRFVQISQGGGNLIARIGGKQVAKVSFEPNEDAGKKALTIPVPAGKTILELDNDGPDWVRLASIAIPGAGTAANAIATGNKATVLLRIEKQAQTPDFSTPVANLPLADGSYTLTIYDLDKKSQVTQTVTIKNQTTTKPILINRDDAIFTLTRK